MNITENISEDNDTNDTNDTNEVNDINDENDDINVEEDEGNNEDNDEDTPYSLSFKDYFFQPEQNEVDQTKKIKSHLDILNHTLGLIDYKKRNITQSKSILELKYNKYKKCLNIWNTITIVLSSVLTFIESTKLVFIDEADTETSLTKNFFILSPIAIGTFITCSSGIIKFKKYQEQMEEIYILIDKSITIISKLKKLKDQIFILTRKNKGDGQSNIEHIINTNIKTFFDSSINIQRTYETEIIQEITNVYQETERYINYNDYHKYLNIINYTAYKKHVLSKDKKTFFQDYKHKIHEKRIKDIKKLSLFDKTKVRYCCCHRKKKITIPHKSYDDEDEENQKKKEEEEKKKKEEEEGKNKCCCLH
tara:strand:+ start:153 stop:1244 length:1092 start_codon:yes stop_codon:yes gene_type:complete